VLLTEIKRNNIIMTPIKAEFDLNLAPLYRSEAASKMKELLSFAKEDRKMIRTASSGVFTLTLPTASGITGKVFFIKKTD